VVDSPPASGFLFEGGGDFGGANSEEGKRADSAVKAEEEGTEEREGVRTESETEGAAWSREDFFEDFFFDDDFDEDFDDDDDEAKKDSDDSEFPVIFPNRSPTVRSKASPSSRGGDFMEPSVSRRSDIRFTFFGNPNKPSFFGSSI